MSIYLLSMALNTALRATTQSISGKDFSRKRVLTPETVMHLLISAEDGSLDKMLHIAGIQTTTSTLTQRRAQIPPELFRTVFTEFNSRCDDTDFFRGYRLLAVDGTAINLPRNSDAPSFVCNDSIPKGVNQLHATPLYDILGCTFADVVMQPGPKKDEIGAFSRVFFISAPMTVCDRGTQKKLLSFLSQPIRMICRIRSRCYLPSSAPCFPNFRNHARSKIIADDPLLLKRIIHSFCPIVKLAVFSPSTARSSHRSSYIPRVPKSDYRAFLE